MRATLDGLELRPGGRVLDLATGTGELTRRLLERQGDLTVVAIDLSRAMLVRGLTKPDLSPWRPVQGDATRLPFDEGAFDAVLCANAFHHFPRPAQVLAEVRRVLRPGGTLALTDWCDDYLTCKLCSIYLRLTVPSFRRTYSLRGCRRMLQAAGFRVVAHRKFKMNWLWGLMRLEAHASGIEPGRP